MEIKTMRVFFLILVLALAGMVNKAFAADDFGSPFANQAPSALSDAPFVQETSPWDVEPAAGEEAADAETSFDLPASDEAVEQLKALENEHSNIIVDDLSP